MSTILTGIILIAVTAGIILFLAALNKKKTERRNRELINVASKAGASLGLSFSSMEIFKDKIIGLDGVKRQLLILDFLNDNTVISIRLADIKECSLKKEYEQVNFGNEKKTDMEQRLNKICLRFSFRNRPDHFFLSFYDSMLHSVYEIAELEAKAKHWELLLSKLMLRDTAATV